VLHKPHRETAAIEFVGGGLAGGAGTDYKRIVGAGHKARVSYGESREIRRIAQYNDEIRSGSFKYPSISLFEKEERY